MIKRISGMILLIIAVIGIPLVLMGQAVNPILNITEEDGSPSTYPYKLKFTNSTVTDNGDGTVSIGVSGIATSPGGNNREVQFNSVGSFAGDSDFAFSTTNNTAIITSTSTATLAAKKVIYTPSVSQTITNAGHPIFSSGSYALINPTSDFVLSSTPTILHGTNGQALLIHNTSSSYTIDFQDDSILPGTKIFLGGAESTLQPNSTMTLCYNSADQGWIVTSNPNTASVGASADLLQVRNISGSAIATGKAVYVSGWNVGLNRAQIDLADATKVGTMPAIGITESAIPNGANGEVITFGEAVGKINTSGQSVGDPVYVSTAGNVVFARPSFDQIQKIGTVARTHATNGVVLIVGAGRINDVPIALTASTATLSGNMEAGTITENNNAVINLSESPTWTGTHTFSTTPSTAIFQFGTTGHRVFQSGGQIFLQDPTTGVKSLADLSQAGGLTSADIDTFAELDAIVADESLANTDMTGQDHSNLVVKFASVTAVDIDADVLQVGDLNLTSVNETCTITTSGLNGLEASDSEGANKWYEIYIIAKADGTVDSLMNEAGTAIGTMPTDYVYSRLAGYCRNNASSNILSFHTNGYGVFYYDTYYTALSGGTASSFTAVDLTAYLPPKSTRAIGFCSSTDSAATCTIKMRATGDTNFQTNAYLTTGNSSATAIITTFVQPTNTSQSVDYYVEADDIGGNIYITGFEVNL